MKILLLTISIYLWIPLMSIAQNKSHHTEDGFKNPFPGFEEKGFGDFIQWSVIDRIKGNKPDKPDSYNFPVIENDGKYLRENKTEFAVTWIGHSTLLIQIDGLNILTDPIWSDRCSPVQFAGPKRHVKPGVKLEDLPKIDAIIISHNHYDHLDRLTIEHFGNDPVYFVPLGIGEFLEDLDITNYEELDWWDELSLNGINFACVPAQHFSNRSMFDRNKTLWSGWVIKGSEQTIYFAGDTGYFPGFAEIGQKYGPISIAAIPIGAYLPRWFMSPVHVSPREAVQAFLDIKADYFVPIHWGTFELADEPLDNPPKVLKEEIDRLKLDTNNFVLLQHGETKIFKTEKVLTSVK
ncbi:MAG: MBL fold metallo-hydrolase [Calditrichia bacterium]|nr:MBL fold metallo-hydrolase [Calditrichia bacterium]